ncbi:FkbM family methyltransferase [Candidatus Peregrinibacteria bacterium]|nr:FkbM family methyltransferase [Candidatus Peregrinibacteria bacterium]
MHRKLFNIFPDNLKDLRTILLMESRKIPDLFFLQVGANDGVRADSIHDFVVNLNWKGMLLEPLKEPFEKLKINYAAQKNLIFENLAIHPIEGRRNIYKIRKNSDNMPDWYDQTASFKYEAMIELEYAIPNVEDYLEEVEVECSTVASLIKKHDIQKIDLVCIDVEGFDFEVIKLLDFNKKPKLILFESCHLGDADKSACGEFLKTRGYKLLEKGRDTLAVLEMAG